MRCYIKKKQTPKKTLRTPKVRNNLTKLLTFSSVKPVRSEQKGSDMKAGSLRVPNHKVILERKKTRREYILETQILSCRFMVRN